MRMTVKELDAYQVISEKYVKELNSEGIILEHKKTGARIFRFLMRTKIRCLR